MPLHPRTRHTKPPLTPVLPKLAVIVIALVLLVVLTQRLLPSSPTSRLVTLPEELSPHKCPSTRNPPLYVFLHMHKTAGNALKNALFAFATRNNLKLFHTCHQAVPDSPLVAWWLNREKSLTSLDCNLDALQNLPAPNRSAISFIAGHQHHGAHTLFPTRPPRYFTFLRHPLLRKASHFLHFEPANASITDYLLTRNRNYMTKRLATRVPSSDLALHFRATAIDTDPFAAAAALAAAKGHLTRHFFFVGLHHRYAQSLCVLAHILNRACRDGNVNAKQAGKVDARLASVFPLHPERIATHHVNVGGRTDSVVASLPEKVRQKVLEAEAIDVQLYKFAEQLFEAKLALYTQCLHATE